MCKFVVRLFVVTMITGEREERERRETETDRERQTETERDRQRETERVTERDRERDRETERDRENHSHIIKIEASQHQQENCISNCGPDSKGGINHALTVLV